MHNMFGAIYKLFKDKTFKVTLIIGIILSIALPLLYLAIDSNSEAIKICNGANFLISSASPVQNFGLAIPINLISLIVGEFTFGTIRNKVIVGYRKSTIYFELFVSSLIFTFVLMTVYICISIGLSSIIGGGFDPTGSLTGSMIGKWIAIIIVDYIFVTSVSLCLSTLIRHQGFAVGATILAFMICFISAMIIAAEENLSNIVGGSEEILKQSTFKFAIWLNPLFIISSTPLASAGMGSYAWIDTSEVFLASILSPLIYSFIFFVVGSFFFSKRDLK